MCILNEKPIEYGPKKDEMFIFLNEIWAQHFFNSQDTL